MTSTPTLVSLLLLVSVAVPAAKRTITHEDVFTMARTSRPVVSPDGRWVVYNVAEPSYDPAKTTSDLWIVAPDGQSKPRRLTSTKETESGAAWSPDSKWIAFSAKRDADQAEQVYVLGVDAGDARRVTTTATAASGPRWRPDGKAILFESLIKSPSAVQDQSTARAFDAMPIRYWNAWLDGSRPHIFVQELDGGTAVDWLAGTTLAATSGFDGLFTGDGATRALQPAWSPDGQEIVFVAGTNQDAMMREDVQPHLFRMKKGQEPVAFGSTIDSFGEPAFSPDGRVLVAKYQKATTAAHPYTLTRLARFDWPSGGGQRLLADTLDRGVGSFTITPDSAAVLFDARDGGFTQLYRVPLAGGAPKRVFEVREGNYESPAQAGGAIIATYVASTQPTEIVRVDASTGTHKLLTDANRAVLDALDLPKPEHFWFTAKNGKRIHNGGYLMNWFNGHTNQFRCLVIHAGASNNESQYGVNDGGIGREWRMGGPVWEGKGQWMDQSPFRYAANWKTPALITQGELDFRVPLNESITTFKLLQRQGVRARLVTFPDEGHWILKGENSRRHLAEIHAWLQKYLG